MNSAFLFSAALALYPAADALSDTRGFYPDFQKLSDALYIETPNIPDCATGRLRDSEKKDILDVLNDIRQLHGLSPVSYNDNAEPQVMQAALMFAANGQIAHSPPPDWRCYSTAGAKAASQSLISGGVKAPNIVFHTPVQDIIEWLTDTNASIKNNIDHRRWLLDPFLKKVAYGRVSGMLDSRNQSVGSALLVVQPSNMHDATSHQEIIAYPYHDYPTHYYAQGTPLSFSLLIDNIHKQGNAAVDFSQAQISISADDGTQPKARKLAFDNRGNGLPNSLQFCLGRIKPSVRYTVDVQDVRINGLQKSYRYWFRIGE